MPVCMLTFCESGYKGVPLQSLVDKLHPNFACERESCSTFSPGPVTNDEDVAFVLLNPTHYDSERKEVVPLAFQEITNRDLSLIRCKYSTKKELENTIDELVARGMARVPPSLRFVEHVAIARASEVRSVVDQQGRMFAVYDTALQDKKGHASVFTRSDIIVSKAKRAKARNELHSLFAKTITDKDVLLSMLP